jgi:DNA-binding response OmpR family regulator
MDPTPQSPTVSPLDGLRVLLVDDSRDYCTVMGMLLELSGIEVRAAHSGQAALAAADECRPHVVLLDISLPDLSGYEVCRRMRSRPNIRSATIIALSGRDETEDRTRARAAGFDHYVLKPADLEDLLKLFPSPAPPA